jgi:HTH-type transcriptional regulator / antitoxin HipB
MDDQAILPIPEGFKMLEEEKMKISEDVYKRIKEKRLTMKKVSKNIEGLSASQVSRIVYGENYNIHTLLKVLDFLDLEIEIVPKEKE